MKCLAVIIAVLDSQWSVSLLKLFTFEIEFWRIDGLGYDLVLSEGHI